MPFSSLRFFLALLLPALLAMPAKAMYYHCRNSDGSEVYQHHQCSATQMVLGMSAYVPGHELPPPPMTAGGAAPAHAKTVAPVDTTSASADGHANVVYGGYHEDPGSFGSSASDGGRDWVVHRGGGQAASTDSDSLRPRVYPGAEGSWLKKLFVKFYTPRCSKAIQSRPVVTTGLWSASDADTFCHCVGATFYESSINYDGLKKAANSHGDSMKEAATDAGEHCVSGSTASMWEVQ